MTAPLSFRRVTKRYGARAVLDALDLELHAGETLGLVGMNGAGKSTLLKAALDLTTLDAGSITIGGVDHRRANRSPISRKTSSRRISRRAVITSTTSRACIA